MDQQFGWFVGLDWASTLHRVCVLNDEGERVAERDVDHSGARSLSCAPGFAR